MAKVSAWMHADSHGACRVLEGKDPEVIANRVAFIEKTPRVRIRDERYQKEDWLNWAARDWKGDGPDDEDSRKWCDDMLLLLGYELPA